MGNKMAVFALLMLLQMRKSDSDFTVMMTHYLTVRRAKR